jgi:hypothetical protein
MKRSMGRWISLLVMLAPGAGLLGSSCVSDIRESIISGGLDYVSDTVYAFLQAISPVEEALGVE